MRKALLLGVILIASGLTSACGGGGTVTGDLAREVGICFGRVIDRSTRSGIADATVEIFAGAIPSKDDNTEKAGNNDVNFVVKTTTVADDADTTLFNEAGMFRFQNLPTGDGTGFRVRIAATNYATIETTCDPIAGVTASSDNTPVAEDMGDITLTKGVSVTISVVNVNTGAAIASCPVYAFPNGTSDEAAGSGNQNSGVIITGIEVVGTTDTSGNVTLAGLNPLIDYNVVVPACDTDADGDYDFRTGVTALDSLVDSATQFTVAVGPAQADDTPALVASSCAQFGATEDGAMPGCGVAANGAMTFVFNYPVAATVTGDLQMALGGDAAFASGILAIAGAVDFDGDETGDTPVDTAITPALSAGNTVLTVTPTAALSANGLYTLDGTVSASVPGAGAVGDIISLDFGTLLTTLQGNALIYAFGASDSTIADPTADNYNGNDDGVGATAVCLEFDELVVGSVQLEATTAAGVTTVLSGPTRVNLNTGTLINEGDNPAGTCGGAVAPGCPSVTDATCVGALNETEAIKYVVPLGTALADHTAGANNSVTVYVDAQDYAGNRLQEEFTLSVQ